jgi:hypothetical protein
MSSRSSSSWYKLVMQDDAMRETMFGTEVMSESLNEYRNVIMVAK